MLKNLFTSQWLDHKWNTHHWAVWDPYYSSHIQQLEKVQQHATWRIYNDCSRFSSVSAMSVGELSWPSLDTSKISRLQISHFWNHFTQNFDPLNPNTLHYLCPCIVITVLLNIYRHHYNVYFHVISFTQSFYNLLLAVGINLQTISTPL